MSNNGVTPVVPSPFSPGPGGGGLMVGVKPMSTAISPAPLLKIFLLKLYYFLFFLLTFQ